MEGPYQKDSFGKGGGGKLKWFGKRIRTWKARDILVEDGGGQAGRGRWGGRVGWGRGGRRGWRGKGG